MPRLVPLAAEPGTAFVDGLRRAWDAGDAVLPVDPRLPPPARDRLLAALGASEEVQPGDALVVSTSGTTGEPRGAVLTFDGLLASALATSVRLGVDPACDLWLSALPLAHIGGLAVVLRSLATGTPLTFAWDDGAATLVSLVPTQLHRLTAAEAGRFRAILVGGSADWRAGAGPAANVVSTYGMTETGSGVVYDGLPLDGVDIRVDPADEQILVRGPMLLRAYRDGSDPKTADGWLATGDAGWLDDGGRLHVRGRMGDVIVTGGEKVWPEAVERVLRHSPLVSGLADVAIAGVADPEWGRRVVAFVTPVDPGEPPTLDAVRAAVKAELPAYCAPKQVVLVKSLPRTTSGKVQRHRLTDSA